MKRLSLSFVARYSGSVKLQQTKQPKRKAKRSLSRNNLSWRTKFSPVPNFRTNSAFSRPKVLGCWVALTRANAEGATFSGEDRTRPPSTGKKVSSFSSSKVPPMQMALASPSAVRLSWSFLRASAVGLIGDESLRRISAPFCSRRVSDCPRSMPRETLAWKPTAPGIPGRSNAAATEGPRESGTVPSSRSRPPSFCMRGLPKSLNRARPPTSMPRITSVQKAGSSAFTDLAEETNYRDRRRSFQQM
mmetsp:Transcript_24582/g.54766  ORF Transcript_24582/g.54766 Transcript_24582/m.54766 type:complete len:246 (-) Transcript_24582:53-790(-)